MKWRAMLATMAALAAVAPVRGGTLLAGFDSPAELAACHPEGRTGPVSEITISDRFVTQGAGCLLFTVPKWHAGLGEWPAFEVDPAIRDWSGFDRLVFDVTNPTPTRQMVALFITDSRVATRSGLYQRVDLAPRTIQRVVVRLSGLAAAGVNSADIKRIHLFTERPAGDMALHIDALMLLHKGEPVPAVDRAVIPQLRSIIGPSIDGLLRTLESGRRSLATMTDRSPALRRPALAQLAALASKARAIARTEDGILDASARMLAIETDLGRLETQTRLQSRWSAVARRVEVGGVTGVVVGTASSMEKVLPRAGLPELDLTGNAEVSLARNEKEAVQLVVLPTRRDLRDVTVRVGTLRCGRNLLPASAVSVAPVGYVRTRSVPPYGTPHVGWWPDPILGFLKKVDIAKGDAQSFWVRVHAPKGQPAKLYHGTLSLLVGGRETHRLRFHVRVYGFAVPDRSPLPLAITFNPMDYPQGDTEAEQKAWRAEPTYPLNAWRKHKVEWARMLADHYITMDSLYGTTNWEPAWEILAQLKREGRLGRFNLGYYGPCGATGAEIAAWRKATLEMLRPRYEKAKALGMLKEAYIYGCDEAPADLFPTVQRAAELIKAELPGVQVMTTTYDPSYGLGSVIKAVDAWCPLTPIFDPVKAAAARATGREVWWYICCGPHHPHANMFVEYPAIDGRILMGAQAAKYRPDGFLYYEITIWNSRRPIEKGPFTDWDPRSWTTYHGDGNWTCVGPGGTPLATIRLENFRDGLEDLAYVQALEKAIHRAEDLPGIDHLAWLARARAAARVPEQVVESMTRFTHDPSAIHAWRSAMARAIETAP